MVICECDAAALAGRSRIRRLYSHRITSTVISAAYLRQFRHQINPWRWIHQCIAWKASCHLELMSSRCIGWLNGLQALCCCFCYCRCCNCSRKAKQASKTHGGHAQSWFMTSGRSSLVSLFQPKTATIKDIAIALVKICFFAVWRTHRDIWDAINQKAQVKTHGGHLQMWGTMIFTGYMHHSVHFITHQSFAFH